MSRVQLALNVADLDAAVAFYSKLFDTTPAKIRPGYANFAIAEPPLKLVLIEGTGEPGTLNHLGVEVGSTDAVAAAQLRLAGNGLPTTTEENVSCCYAVQDKVWVDGPDQLPWEIYTVLADAETPTADVADHMSRDLARRASAEAVGTAFLVAIVVGSGIYAQRLSPGQPGLQLLENAIATGAGLVALILAIGPISGGHFNPVVTLADRLLGGISSAEGATYVGAQVVGAMVGAITANLMFGLHAVSVATHARSSGALWFAEFIATLGLLTVILGVVRANRSHVAAFAVGGYILAAYWFTSSTSFANPAVTIGRTLSNTFAGIRPSSVPMFLGAQLVGALVAVALAKFWNPDRPVEHLVIES